MQFKTFSAKALKFEALQRFAAIVQSGTDTEALQALKALQHSAMFTGKAWQANFNKLEQVFTDKTPLFSVFSMSGNSKLPFVSFSSLPGVTCPGAGACLEYCYSYRAWRYPAAFARQAQNAFMMRHNQGAIAQALNDVNASFKGQSYDVRLYVDGDFSSPADVSFWFDLIKLYPAARVYGYSKSFDALLAYTGDYPTNYLLNISGGHNASPDTVQRVKALPITRGDFIAVSIGRKVKSTDHGKPETNKALREAFKIKAFTCPGTCGTCTGKGHACGMSQLKGLPIVIAIH